MALRALSSGISGLQANQTALDVIGHNIANINTAGFKSERALFADQLSQTIAGGSAPTGAAGGKDPMQIGLGTTVSAIRTSMVQGAALATDNPTDLMIQGDGFFILRNGADTAYTRTGAFTLDAGGKLVDTTTGHYVQGVGGDITIAPGTTVPASATTSAIFGGNLDASVADGTTYPLTFSVNDSLGGAHTMTLTFTKDFAGGAGQWDWAVTESDAAIASLAGSTGTVTFGTSGAVSAGSTGGLGVTFAATAGVVSPQNVTLDFGTVTNTAPLAGFAGASSVSMTSQNGYTAGSLTSFAIGADGTITGHYSNGRNDSIGQLELVSFANPGGLERQGQNLFKESVNSGPPQRGVPGTGGRGSLLTGSLEASNVDLAREFTELITAQRGFEASAKIIRIGDEILQTAVNIKQ